MHYVELDAKQPRALVQRDDRHDRITGQRTTTDYIVYFSDRRNNHSRTLPSARAGSPARPASTAIEDVINNADSNGVPNNTLDTGEDVNGHRCSRRYGTLQTSGLTPQQLPARRRRRRSTARRGR